MGPPLTRGRLLVVRATSAVQRVPGGDSQPSLGPSLYETSGSSAGIAGNVCEQVAYRDNAEAWGSRLVRLRLLSLAGCPQR